MHATQEKNVVILFTRYPVAGQTKTRLIPALGAEGAAQLQKSMTEFAMQQLRLVTQRISCEIHVHFMGATQECMQTWLGDDVRYFPQGEGDIGQRMHTAFCQAFATGASKVLLMGSDCPDIRAANIVEAFTLLEANATVFIPTFDGGYCLVGLTQTQEALFTGIAWSTEAVLAQTLAKAPQAALLSPMGDVDYEQDIPEKISVVIPAYNEEKCISKAIHSALQGFAVEVLVADGGSTDDTRHKALELGARVFLCPEEHRGRARQMNFAAKHAQGSIVLFLHADSILPEQWDVHVRRAMREDETRLGFFTFAVTGDFVGKSLLTWGTNVRAKLFHKPYGDQGFFLKKAQFFSLGAYADVPILEDVFLANAAKAQGGHVCVPLALETSGRRWQERGPLKVTLFNQAILLAASLGMDLHKVRNAYRSGSFWA